MAGFSPLGFSDRGERPSGGRLQTNGSTGRCGVVAIQSGQFMHDVESDGGKEMGSGFTWQLSLPFDDSARETGASERRHSCNPTPPYPLSTLASS